MEYQEGTIDIITMGCSKNLVDSERLIKRLHNKGYRVSHDTEQPRGEYVVVNTCGFIGDAKEESINLILRLGQLKREKKIGKLVVMGCLSERYRKELPAEIPEVDIWYGKYDWKGFIESLPDKTKIPDADRKKLKDWERTLTTHSWSAYVKISEGCDRFCSYCAIPIITGRHKSREIEEILEEVRDLAKNGVKEFNIIAQDLSSYGLDLYGVQCLGELIDRMASISGVEWIRLHYLYPTDFPMEILNVMNKHENVCKYIDIALQHISDKVLKGMNRKISKAETLQLLKEIREKVPGIHIRTTLMTGFPGEGDEEFQELKEFVKDQKFERLGGFAYSEEEDTLAAKNLNDVISQEVKDQRISEIMALQQDISEEHNHQMIGQRLKVLIDEKEGSKGYGRSEFDSPEVDQEIIIEDCGVTPGNFAMIEVVAAAPFELKGKIIDI